MCIYEETWSFSSFLISVDFQSNLKFIFGVNWWIDICVQVFEADSWQVCGEWLYAHLLPSWSDQGEQAFSQLASRCLSGVWQEVGDASVSERFMSALTTLEQLVLNGSLKLHYRCVCCRYKKNIKALYIVHPTMFIRTLLILFKPIIRSVPPHYA